ncbi:5196_t:CDS:2, partial [Cetraspora pellucida]
RNFGCALAECFFLSVCPHCLPAKTTFKHANNYDFLEWAEPKRFTYIKLLAKGGYGTISTATWIDGPRYRQEFDSYKHSRHKLCRNPNETVGLKTLYDSSDGIEKLFKELRSYYNNLNKF